MTKETLEEALNRLKEKHTILNFYPATLLQNMAEFGAKWQQEEMYSELSTYLQDLANKDRLKSLTANQIRTMIEQFKK